MVNVIFPLWRPLFLRSRIWSAQGLYVFIRHAVDGMKEHGIRASEALNVILDATECEEQENGRYRFDGDAAPGKPIRVIVEKTANATVLTVHLILDEE